MLGVKIFWATYRCKIHSHVRWTYIKKFDSMMSGHSFVDADGTKRYQTLSGGIMIAHHLTSLSDVFKLARKAEKEAKLVKNKNALAIILSKRSGTLEKNSDFK
jgi:CRISPR/Cas system-associated protein Cas10 (large subunit of type III CRISPR-Cas system)